MKVLHFLKNSSIFFCGPCFYVTAKKFKTARLCYTVTCNSPGDDIERPVKYVFSMRFISGW